MSWSEVEKDLALEWWGECEYCGLPAMLVEVGDEGPIPGDARKWGRLFRAQCLAGHSFGDWEECKKSK